MDGGRGSGVDVVVATEPGYLRAAQTGAWRARVSAGRDVCQAEVMLPFMSVRRDSQAPMIAVPSPEITRV